MPALAEPPDAGMGEGGGEQEGESHRPMLGVRGVLGGVFSAEEEGGRFGGGGTLALGVPLWAERLELEATVSAIKGLDRPTLGVTELVLRLLFESRALLRPHLALGPALSIDFAGRKAVAGGFAAGPGCSLPVSRRASLTADLLYRFLSSREETEHVLTLGMGVAVKL